MRRTEHYREIFLEPDTDAPLKIDLVQDFGPQYGEHIRIDRVIVDSIENIGANKITAILGRTEPKDFVTCGFRGTLAWGAQTKDTGTHPFYLAGSLRQVLNFRRLPVTTPPLALFDLQRFMLALADRMLEQTRPPGNDSAT
ncbi:MAG: hypothetical protein IPO15_22360 [Anaerolineae bacterium]|uniref:hypothetical protein n=1 Tax=Candidatus Amarolinea dominans TaxID=3140696 RepID=UPI003136FFE8|nr:hypothetical protein [Anaerolineae bacterium]